MFQNRIHLYILIDLVVLITVPILFKLIAAKKIAALIASALFISTALMILIIEQKQLFARHSDPQNPNPWVLWPNLVFLVFIAVPILGLRLLFWDTAFDDIQIFGFSARHLHNISTYLFLFKMLAAKAVDSARRFT